MQYEEDFQLEYFKELERKAIDIENLKVELALCQLKNNYINQAITLSESEAEQIEDEKIKSVIIEIQKELSAKGITKSNFDRFKDSYIQENDEKIAKINNDIEFIDKHINYSILDNDLGKIDQYMKNLNDSLDLSVGELNSLFDDIDLFKSVDSDLTSDQEENEKIKSLKILKSIDEEEFERQFEALDDKKIALIRQIAELNDKLKYLETSKEVVETLKSSKENEVVETANIVDNNSKENNEVISEALVSSSLKKNEKEESIIAVEGANQSHEEATQDNDKVDDVHDVINENQEEREEQEEEQKEDVQSKAKKSYKIKKIIHDHASLIRSVASIAVGVGIGTAAFVAGPLGVPVLTVGASVAKIVVNKERKKLEEKRLNGENVVVKIESPKKGLAGLAQKSLNYLKSEEGLKNISWMLTSAIITANSLKILEGLGAFKGASANNQPIPDQSVTPDNANTITTDSPVNTPATQPEVPTNIANTDVVNDPSGLNLDGIKIGNNVSGYDVSTGYDTAATAVNNITPETLISKYVNGGSIFKRFAIVNPDGSIGEIINTNGLSLQEFLANTNMDVERIAIDVANANGESQAWMSVANLIGKGPTL